LPGDRLADTNRTITHEIISGERRWRASGLAGLATLPVMICDMTDQAVLECQIVENLQRDDLLPLEEAEAFGDWMFLDGINAEQVAAKIGKSRQYVVNRLNLLSLSAECKQALRDGLIDASRASEIARVKDTALQSKILTEAVRTDFRGDVPSVRQLRNWIGLNIMLRLDRASFDVASPSLIIKAGSCSACPKRTGANPDLFADALGPDLCTDPACFKDKQEAHHTQMMIMAEKSGMRIIAGADAENICMQYSNGLSGYSRLTQVRADLTAPGEHLLGAVLPPLLYPAPTLDMSVLAAYLQGLAANENRPGMERESLSSAATGLNQLARLQGEASVMRLLLREAAELIDGLLSDFGLDFEDIDDKARLLGQIRRALGEDPS